MGQGDESSSSDSLMQACRHAHAIGLWATTGSVANCLAGCARAGVRALGAATVAASGRKVAATVAQANGLWATTGSAWGGCHAGRARAGVRAPGAVAAGRPAAGASCCGGATHRGEATAVVPLHASGT